MLSGHGRIVHRRTGVADERSIYIGAVFAHTGFAVHHV